MQLPKKLNKYFGIIEKEIVSRRIMSQNNYNTLKNQLIEYVMNKLYEKIYPQELTMNDSETFKKCVMLSWAEPKYFINKKRIMFMIIFYQMLFHILNKFIKKRHLKKKWNLLKIFLL